jgi:hypothetical protein
VVLVGHSKNKNVPHHFNPSNNLSWCGQHKKVLTQKYCAQSVKTAREYHLCIPTILTNIFFFCIAFPPLSFPQEKARCLPSANIALSLIFNFLIINLLALFLLFFLPLHVSGNSFPQTLRIDVLLQCLIHLLTREIINTFHIGIPIFFRKSLFTRL